MAIDLSQFYQVFFEEAGEHLAAMEGLLLDLDVGSPDLETLNAIFRAAHSIKGGAATFGFSDMTEVTHVLETLLDRLRKQELAPTVEMIDTFLQAGDIIKEQLAAHQSGTEYRDPRVAEICGRLETLANMTGVEESQSSQDAETGSVEVREAADVLEDDGFGFFADAPGAELVVDREEDGFGLFGGSPGMAEIAAIAERAREEEEQGFGFFDSAPGAPGEDAAEQTAPAEPVAPVKAVQPRSQSSSTASKRAATGESSIRVSVEKVDQLINLVGELVITHAMLAQSASELDPVLYERIFNGLSSLERNSRDLQQAVMSIRMMPISFVFNRFPRVVRDTAASLGKKVQLKLIGEDTELDKGLIERLADPLNHLVRNSIDHGIESPEQRREAGKPESGQITLRASHRGGSVVVEVSDDGAGLDREKLLAKAASQGIAMPDSPSDKEVWQLIFHPGFSTAERVTDISGRGVGMDVVRRNIEEMNGRVDIESMPGQGTQITIRLPLTLAILDGLSVRMGEEIFILPLTAIQESIQPRPEQLKTVVGRGRVVQINDTYLPLVVLHDVFNFSGRGMRPEDGILVIVDTSEGRAAVLVEELVAQHQVVIKSLETNYRKVEGISGATIMGDGRVALILDVDALVRLNRKAA